MPSSSASASSVVGEPAHAQCQCELSPASSEMRARCEVHGASQHQQQIHDRLSRLCCVLHMLLVVCSHLVQAWTAHCAAHCALLGNLETCTSCMRPLRRMRRITHNSQLRPTRTSDKCARKHSLRRPAALRYAACSQAAAPLHTTQCTLKSGCRARSQVVGMST